MFTNKTEKYKKGHKVVKNIYPEYRCKPLEKLIYYMYSWLTHVQRVSQVQSILGLCLSCCAWIQFIILINPSELLSCLHKTLLVFGLTSCEYVVVSAYRSLICKYQIAATKIFGFCFNSLI